MLEDRTKRERQGAKAAHPAKRQSGYNTRIGRSPALESAERKAQQQEAARTARQVSGPLRQPSGALGKMSYAAEEVLSQSYRPPRRLPGRKMRSPLAPAYFRQQASIAERVAMPMREEEQSSARGISAEEQQKLADLEMYLPRVAGKIDYWLLVVVLALLCIGLVMVYSASSFISAQVYGDASYYFQKQMLWAFLGIIAMLVTMRIDYRQWRRFTLPAMVVILPLLVVVLIFGRNVYGATRWIPLGPFFSFQPSELTKLVLALYIADWLARKGKQVGTFLYGLAPFVILVGIILGLVLLEKDMGTALILAGLATTMFFTAGANIIQFLLALFCGGAIFLSQAFSSYRFYRLKGFIDPFKDVTGINAQLYQSLLALGSGGWFGLGLGASRQKTGYLPLPYVDSIFAITGEELGFIGCFLIILLFMFLAFRGFRLARRTQDMYGALLATGITTWLVLQAMINIGASTASIPYTGVPLPFISFGGSSLVVTMAAVGVLLNISRYIQEPDAPALSRRALTKTISKKKA